MAKKVVLLVLAMLMVLSSCTAVVFGAERVYLYKQDFEHFETGIHHNDGGMYDYGIAGDSYITATIHEDERGKYLQASPQNATEPARITMWRGDEGFAASPDSSGVWVMNQDFVVETKIKPASGTTTFTMGPTSDVKANWKSGDNYKIASLTANESVTVMKNGVAESTNYKTESDTWYDVLIYTDFGASSPKFSLYIKKETEDKYACVAENVDYPSGDYSQGVSIFGFMLVHGACSAYVDKIAMYYPEDGYSIPVKEVTEEPENARTYLYKQSFDGFPVGKNHSDGGRYDYGMAGESYITATIYEDERGKYLQASPQNATEPARITMWQGDEGFASSPDASGVWVLNRDFAVETKIKPASGTTTFTMGPTSDVKVNWKNGDNYKIASLTANESVTVMKNGVAESTNYKTESDTWYDVLIYTAFDASSPKFSLYIKKETEDKYACVAENVDYPSGNYSQGVSIFGFMLVHGACSAYVDEIVMYYPEVDYSVAVKEQYEVTLSDAENGTLSFAEGFASSVWEGDDVTVTVTPDEGYQMKSVTVNGQDMTALVQNGTLTFAVTEDATVVASFEEKPAVAAGILAESTSFIQSEYDGHFAFLIYSKLNDFTVSGEAMEYGIKLRKSGVDGEIVLPAMVDTNTKAVATPNAQFGIKIYGEAIEENAFYAVPYVGTAEGSEMTVSK